MKTATEVEPEREFTVKGQGRFRAVKRRPNGELNAWGPLGRWKQRMRTFSPDQPVTLHRKVDHESAVGE